MSKIKEALDGYASVSDAPRLGRSMRDGYARGHGIAYGNLPAFITREEDYQEAVGLTAGWTICSEHRLMNLYLLIRFYLPKLGGGDIIEFGSYRGGSALFMAYLAKRHLPGARVFGLDTFEGMPTTDKKVDLHSAGDFKDTDLTRLNAYARSLELHNLTFVKGLFEHTAVKLIRENKLKLALAHIDCDIYSAIVTSWEAVKPAMVKGGYAVFDDATESSCLGATEAVERELIQKEQLCSEQIYPHYVFRYPPLPS